MGTGKLAVFGRLSIDWVLGTSFLHKLERWPFVGSCPHIPSGWWRTLGRWWFQLGQKLKSARLVPQTRTVVEALVGKSSSWIHLMKILYHQVPYLARHGRRVIPADGIYRVWRTSEPSYTRDLTSRRQGTRIYTASGASRWVTTLLQFGCIYGWEYHTESNMAKVIHCDLSRTTQWDLLGEYDVGFLQIASRCVFFLWLVTRYPSLDEGPCIYSEGHLPCQIELEAIKQDTRLKIPYLSRLGLWLLLFRRDNLFLYLHISLIKRYISVYH